MPKSRNATTSRTIETTRSRSDSVNVFNGSNYVPWLIAGLIAFVGAHLTGTP